MDAKEAREKSELANDTTAHCQLKVIKAYIEEATKKGEFEYIHHGSICDLTQTKLEDEGYKVDYKQDGMSTHFKISW